MDVREDVENARESSESAKESLDVIREALVALDSEMRRLKNENAMITMMFCEASREVCRCCLKYGIRKNCTCCVWNTAKAEEARRTVGKDGVLKAGDAR